MTGNQYFIVILAGILAYFIVSMVDLHVRYKKEVRMSQELNRLHEENMKQLEIIKGVINGKS